MMKLKFDPSLDFQQDAIEAVVDLFSGQPLVQSSFEISQRAGASGLVHAELGVGNAVTIPPTKILENLRAIQARNDIEMLPRLQEWEGDAMNFSIEMETGTGKTYVYLRSIFELAKKYGFRKFVIVVPSVAVREGVMKSIEMTRAHFSALYDNEPFHSFVYDSRKLNAVRQFAGGNQIQIMIINIQAFVKDLADKPETEMTEDELKKLNVIHREHDKMQGHKPIEFIQAVSPVVIIDEPQSVDNTPKARRAIGNLKPAAVLRYSATHKNPYNLLYKLDPVRAYDLRLVKRIEVASIRADDNFNDAYVKLLQTDNSRGIRARIEIHKLKRNGDIGSAKILVKVDDDLFAKSGEIALYRQGYVVSNIDCTPGAEYIEFNQSKSLALGKEMGGTGDEVMKAQVFEAVEQHLKKERALKGKGIKVLSLFFIDKVANYRVYQEDGTTALGKIGQWFEEAFRELTEDPRYKGLIPFAVGEVHGGYFSQDKQGHDKDTRGNTKDDEGTYNLIMRDKERLLDEAVALRFIFSHSALREGWDNPNVFQICTLNETRSQDKKRQEIGRGLRLPVNRQGERVHDEHINRLTVIANESYEDFARTLQSELEEDFGIRFGKVEKIAFAKLVTKVDGTEEELGQEASARIWQEMIDNGYLNDAGEILDRFDPKNPHFDLNVSDEFVGLKAEIIDEIKKKIFKTRIVDARDRQTISFNKQVQLSPEFQELWARIKHRTRYRVTFETNELIEKAAQHIADLEVIKPVHLSMTLVDVNITGAGVQAGRPLYHRKKEAIQIKQLPDLLAYLQKETELTRDTLVRTLKQSGRLSEFLLNPQQFMAATAKAISRALHDLMLDGIQYDKLPSREWEMRRIEPESETELTRYLNNLYKVQNKNKSLFDFVEFDSTVEEQFAKDLDKNENVKVFVKLPRWFKIDTPIGPYNPDWAFVTEREKRLYFVRETKSTKDSSKRRNEENQKIDCGKKHFKTLDVDFDTVTKLSEVAM